MSKRTRSVSALVTAAATTSALVLAPPSGTAAEAPAAAAPKMAKHKVVATDPSGCVGEGEDAQCFGATGRVRVVTPGGGKRTVLSGLLSAAGPDGSFAVGSDGAAKLGDTVWSILT